MSHVSPTNKWPWRQTRPVICSKKSHPPRVALCSARFHWTFFKNNKHGSEPAGAFAIHLYLMADQRHRCHRWTTNNAITNIALIAPGEITAQSKMVADAGIVKDSMFTLKLLDHAPYHRSVL